MRGLGARIEGLAALLAVLLLLVVLTGHLLEASGWLHRRLAAELARQTGDAVRFERVSIDWRGPGLSLDGVVLLGEPRAGGERRELARVDRVDLRVGVSAGGPGVRAVRVRGGNVRLGPELYEALGTLATANASLRGGGGGGGGEADRPSAPPDPRRTPRAKWNGLEVELDLPGGASQPLGRLDLWWRPAGPKGPELLGLVTPKFGPGRAQLDGIALRGEWDGKSALDLVLHAPSVAVPRGALPEDVWLGELGFSDVEGRLAVDARGSVSLDGSAPPQLDLALVLDELRFQSADPLFGAEEASLQASIGFAPGPAMSPLAADAWSGRVALGAFWNQSPISLNLDLGRDAGPGRLARLELWAPRVPVGSPVTLRTTRACTGPRTGEALGDAWAALEPGGVAALALVAELPEVPDLFERDDPPEPHIVLHVDTLGETSLRFLGWPDDRGKRQGFPVPLEGIRGTLVFAHDPAAPRRDRFGMVDVAAAPPTGSARFEGLIVSPRPEWTMTRPEVRMDLALEGLAVDGDLALGLSGLDLGFDPFARFEPRAGTASGRVRFEQLESNGGMRLLVEAGVEGTHARIQDGGLDLAVADANGRLRLAFARESWKSGLDTHRPLGAAFELSGKAALPPDGRPADLAASGAWREAIAPKDAERADTLALRWSLGAIELGDPALASALGNAGVELDGWELAGSAEVHGVLAADAGPGTGALALEAEGSELGAAGAALPVALGSWRGLASVRIDGNLLQWLANRGAALPVHAAAAARGPFAGGALAAGRVEMDPSGTTVQLAGARLDPNAPALRAALVELAGAPPSDPSEGLLPGGVEIEGHFDVSADLAYAAGAAATSAPAVRLYPRSPTLRAPGFELADLRGRLDLSGERVRSERLDARFGDTVLQLEDVELWRRDPDGRWRGGPRPMAHPGQADSKLLLGMRLSFVDLAFDGERLRALGVEALGVEASGEDTPDESAPVPAVAAPWRLELDARAADVLLSLGSPAGPVAWISGEFVPHDVRVDLGLPIGVSTARVVIERLVVENGDARGWGRADQLYATLGGRSIEDGRMVATYTAGRLTVDDLVARFAGGRITSLGAPIGPGRGPAPSLGAPRPQGRALAVDLIEGGRFDLSLGFDDLEVRTLLAGLVSTEQVTGGRVHASLRLAGLPADPLSLVGSGLVRIERARLGSVPVARAVFTALGFDATATFDRARARFDLAQGVAEIEGLEVQSPLLQLVGAGELGLDGQLAIDLDVEYSVLKALGPLRSLVYWFQNRILRLSVRGDLSRPAVTVRNLLFDLFQRDASDLPVLPLPPPPPLPARF
ncbi:MAG: hypothetical protein GC161_00805 [Planctomycetaceae bacterium]|nr:hypothetical protein [Planctomycetaceae bacterium]